jgi:hypothetical protein
MKPKAQKDQYIILVGDLNVNTQQRGSSRKQLLDVTKAYNLTVKINIPTGVTESMATTIDQIITNMPDKCYYNLHQTLNNQATVMYES